VSAIGRQLTRNLARHWLTTVSSSPRRKWNVARGGWRCAPPERDWGRARGPVGPPLRWASAPEPRRRPAGDGVGAEGAGAAGATPTAWGWPVWRAGPEWASARRPRGRRLETGFARGRGVCIAALGGGGSHRRVGNGRSSCGRARPSAQLASNPPAICRSVADPRPGHSEPQRG